MKISIFKYRISNEFFRNLKLKILELLKQTELIFSKLNYFFILEIRISIENSRISNKIFEVSKGTTENCKYKQNFQSFNSNCTKLKRNSSQFNRNFTNFNCNFGIPLKFSNFK